MPLADQSRAIARVLQQLRQQHLAFQPITIVLRRFGQEIVDPVLRGQPAGEQTGAAGPFRGRKLQLWEGGIRVPFIVRWPGKVPAGSLSSEPVSGVDLLPTLCSLAGVSTPPDVALDGSDMTPALTGVTWRPSTPTSWSP